MMLRFNSAISRSEELHSQHVAAKKLFARLNREKNQLTEILLDLNNSPHYPPEQKLDFDKPVLLDKVDLNEKAKFYLDLIDGSHEYTSDEENAPPEPNAMSLSEWMKRNTSVLAAVEDRNMANGQTRKREPSMENRKRKNSDNDNEHTPSLKRPSISALIER
jgi:hypothetical protein